MLHLIRTLVRLRESFLLLQSMRFRGDLCNKKKK